MATVKDKTLLTQNLCMWHFDLTCFLYWHTLHNNHHALNKLILVKSRHLGIYKTFSDQILFLIGAVLLKLITKSTYFFHFFMVPRSQLNIVTENEPITVFCNWDVDVASGITLNVNSLHCRKNLHYICIQVFWKRHQLITPA